MKNLVLLLIIIYSLSSQGQTLKVETGLMRSTHSQGSMLPYVDYTNGFNLFCGLDYLDFKFINFWSNVGVLQKGGQGNFEAIDNNGDPLGNGIWEIKANYLSLNSGLDLKIQYSDIKIFGFCGVRYDYAFSKNADIERHADYINNSAYGLLYGGGLIKTFKNYGLGIKYNQYYELIYFYSGDYYKTQSKTNAINLVFTYKL